MKGVLMDLSSISAVLTSIKAATDIAKLIKDSDVSLEQAESKLKFTELISALADAKIQIADIQQLIIDKDTELRLAKEQIALKENLTWERPYYWILNGSEKDGPFCQKCYDNDHKLIRLQSGTNRGFWRCRVCSSTYTDSSYNPPRQSSRSNPYI